MGAIRALARTPIADAFGASGLTHDLVAFFCLFVAGSVIFNGALFVANAAFNNLGHAGWSTVFNWGRATLGTIPFVWAGGQWFGAAGVLAGWGLGAVLFGITSVIVCFRLLARIEARNRDDDTLPPPPVSAQSPFTSGKGALGG